MDVLGQEPTPQETSVSSVSSTPAHFRAVPAWRKGLAQRYGVLAVWALLILLFGILKPSEFLTLSFETMLDSQATLLLLALGFIIPLIAGDLDLSLAGSFTVDVVIIGRMDIVHQLSYFYVFGAVFKSRARSGVFQAFLIVKLRLNSMIVTLGTGTAYLGLASALDNTTRSGVGNGYANFMAFQFLDLQVPFWICIAMVLLLWYVYSYTPLGRRLFLSGRTETSRGSAVSTLQDSRQRRSWRQA